MDISFLYTNLLWRTTRFLRKCKNADESYKGNNNLEVRKVAWQVKEG